MRFELPYKITEGLLLRYNKEQQGKGQELHQGNDQYE
jgi:hypothetical protein